MFQDHVTNFAIREIDYFLLILRDTVTVSTAAIYGLAGISTEIVT